jgi:hypothetical protein
MKRRRLGFEAASKKPRYFRRALLLKIYREDIFF